MTVLPDRRGVFVPIRETTMIHSWGAENSRRLHFIIPDYGIMQAKIRAQGETDRTGEAAEPLSSGAPSVDVCRTSRGSRFRGASGGRGNRRNANVINMVGGDGLEPPTLSV
jgi:hypothetical protein